MSDLYPTLSLGEKTPVPNDLDLNFNVAPLQSFSQWSASSGSNINDPLLSAQGYADYQRGHFFRTGELDDEVESSITQGLVGSLLNNQLVTPEQVESEDFLDTLKPQADAQTQANLIRMAYGEQAGSTYLSNIQSESGNQEELDKQLNSAKMLLVDSGILPFARVKDAKGIDKIIGGADITDRGKSLDDAVRLGALNYSDAYRVMSGLKKGVSDASVFENIRQAQLLTELNAILGSEDEVDSIPQDALDTMRELIKAKDEDSDLDQEQDILDVVADFRKGLSSEYARKNGFGEGAALERYSDKEIRDAVELLAANEVNEKGEFKFYDEDDSKNIRILGSGHVLAHPNLMQQRERFEKAIKNDDRLSEDQITSLRNQRKLYRQLTYEQYDKFLADTAATSDNWMAAKQAGRASGTPDVDILDTFLADKRNYSSIKNRLGDIAATVPDAVIGLFASLGAVIFKSEGATKYLVDNQMDRQRRREVAAIFGDEFGWGMDLSNVVAPMVVDVSATALLSATTLGTGGVLYAGAKAGAKQTAKALVKNLTKAATGRQFGDTAKDIALKAAARKKGKDSGDKVVSEGVQEAIKAYNKAIANKTFRKAAPFPPLFLTAANRSAGNTYATIYAAQPDSLTHEEKHDAALGYAMMGGTVTGLLTTAFMGIGLGGFEQAFLRGMTYKGMTSGMSKILNLDIRGYGSSKVREVIGSTIEKQMKTATKNSAFLRQFGIPAASEAAEEGLDEFIQTFITDAALNENTPMIDRMMVGLHAASLGGAMGGGVVGVQNMFDKGTGARYERFQQETIDNIIKNLGETGSPLTQAFFEENKEQLSRQLSTAARSREPIVIPTPQEVTEAAQKKAISEVIKSDRQESNIDIQKLEEQVRSKLEKQLITQGEADVILKESKAEEVRETQEGVLDEDLERQLEEGRQRAIEQEEQLVKTFDTVWGTKEKSIELGEGLSADEHYQRYLDARTDAQQVADFWGMESRVDYNEKNKGLGAYRAEQTEEGMRLVINPWGLARLTMGLNKANAQHVARFEASHEVIHHAAWRNLSKAEIDIIFSVLSDTQVNEIIDTYYKTDEKRQAARSQLGPDALSVDQRSMQHVIVDEYLRMKAQRILKGYTTEEEIEFYKTNPSFVRVLLRYLRSYINRFNAIRELDADNPVISAAMHRLTGEMTRLKGGFEVSTAIKFDIDDPENSINKVITYLDDKPFVDRDPNRKIDMGVRQTQEGELDYRGSHRAPDRGYGSPMSAMDESIYPSDFYSSDGLRIYGTGGSYDTTNDQKVYDQIVSVRGNPDAKVTVYRGVPSNVKGGINAGDWVSTDRDYAEMHGARMFGDKGYKVLTKEVKAGELITEGNSIYEFGYSPPTGVRETQAGAFDIDKAVDNLDLDDAAQVESFIKDTLKINDAEFEQLGKPFKSLKTGKPSNKLVLPPVQLIRFIRYFFNKRKGIYNSTREAVRKSQGVQLPELTFDMFAPTPAMTAALIKNEKVSNWHSDMSNFEIPDGYDTIAFVPCAATKPWCDIQSPTMRGNVTYKSYNKMRKVTDDGGVSKKYGRVYYVTISEPLGVVPQDFWHDFPPYDNTGLFSVNPVDQIGRMERKVAVKLPVEDGGIGQTFALPFDVAAYKESINALGNVIASFVETNKKQNPDLNFVSFVSDLGRDKGSHEIMLDKASEIRGESVVSPNENFKKRRNSKEAPAEIMEEKLGPFKYDADLKVDRQKKMEQVSAAAGRIQPVRETQAGSLEGVYDNIEDVPPITSQVNERQVASLVKVKTASDLDDPAEQEIFEKAAFHKNKDRSGILAVAANRLFSKDKSKKINQATYNEIRNRVFPYKNTEVPKTPTVSNILKFISADKKTKDGSSTHGTVPYSQAYKLIGSEPVSIRLDIPTFNESIKKGSPIYAVSIAGPKMKGPKAYTNYARIKLKEITRYEKSAARIAVGRNKGLMASTEGELMEFTPAQLNTFRKNWASGKVGPKQTGDNRWVEVAINPLRSSEFVDITNPLDPVPVVGGSEAIHIGNRVYIQKPVWGSRPDYGREGDVRFTQEGGLESGTFDTAEGGLGYGGYAPLFDLPFFETGKYRKKKDGLFGSLVNKFRGDLDPRIRRLVEQRRQIQDAVEADVVNFKNQLDKIIKEDFDGKAPVALIQALVGSRENISPETEQAYLDLIKGVKSESKIAEIRAKYVQGRRKEFRDRKKKAISELAKIQKVPEKDSNKTRLVRHLLGGEIDGKKALGLRALTDELSTVIRGIVGEDSEMGIAIDDNLQLYLHREYKLFSDKEYRDNIRTDSRYDTVRKNAGDFLYKQYKTFNKDWRNEVKNFPTVAEFKAKLVNDYLDLHIKSDRSASNLFNNLKDHAKSIVSLNIGALKRRKNPPQELRELLGQVDDETGYNELLQTFSHLGLIASQINFISNLKKFGMDTKKTGGQPFIIEAELDEVQIEGEAATYKPAPEGYSILKVAAGADTSIINTAPFADGKTYYVLTEMEQAVSAILDPKAKVTQTEADKANQFVTEVGAKLTGLSLGAKTLGSIGFYVRNIASNIVFFGPSQGFWRFGKMGKSLEKEFVRKKYLSMAPEEVSAFHRTMIGLGVIGNEIEARLLQDFLTNPRSEAQLQKELLDNLAGLESETSGDKKALDISVISEKVGKTRAGRFARRLRELSQTVDSFYKIAYFMNELEVLQQARSKHVASTAENQINYGDLSDEELMQMAADKVKKTAQSYDQAPPFVQKLQGTWFGVMFAPFIRFKLEVPRIMLNTVLLARKEMADTNPVIRKRGKNRMIGFTTVLVGFSAISQVVVNALTGIGDEEEEALRDSMPEYLRSNSFFYYTKGGQLKSLDLTYLNPYAMMVDPFLRSFDELMRGSPAEAGAAFFKAMVADQYLDQQILAGAVTSALNNRDPENGRPITEVNDTAWEAFSKKFQFIFSEAYAPRTLEKVYKDGFVKLMEGDPDVSDFIMTPLGALAKEFLPLRPYDIVPEQQLDRFLSERAGEYRRAAALKNRMYTDDSISEDAVRGMADTEIERRRRINEHLIRAFRGFKKLGLTDEQIYSQAIERGYGKRRVALLLNGLMERPALQTPFIRNMAVKGDTHIERLRTFNNQLETYGRYIPVE